LIPGRVYSSPAVEVSLCSKGTGKVKIEPLVDIDPGKQAGVFVCQLLVIIRFDQ
jgi:hypothetical protein